MVLKFSHRAGPTLQRQGITPATAYNLIVRFLLAGAGNLDRGRRRLARSLMSLRRLSSGKVMYREPRVRNRACRSLHSQGSAQPKGCRNHAIKKQRRISQKVGFAAARFARHQPSAG